ncbi:Ig-like domain-containing protein [Pseudomonas schmalbachii]|uniref:Bacterial Ig-like domain-containing protein n=1 Tax=Pseudomonas schmalbachii TaxID=2816993 RepID=A0ABS3TPX3_9PSED|nr:Ig-like domain-containing protein [Pseudomonas schmalbachii]MBO3274740.1 hypothetical protein [Pseudomonas schmalbachii]
MAGKKLTQESLGLENAAATSAAEMQVRNVPSISSIGDDVGAYKEIILHDGLYYTDDSAPTFRGEGLVKGQVVQLYANGVLVGSATVRANGAWSLTSKSEFDQGIVEFKVSLDGKTFSDPIRILIDSEPPLFLDESSLKVAGVGAGQATNIDKPTFSGKLKAQLDQHGNPLPMDTGPTGSYEVVVSANGEEIGRARIQEDGSWSFTPDQPLDDGDYDFEFTVRDVAGNDPYRKYELDHPSLSFTIDTVPPEPVVEALDLVDDVGAVTGTIAKGSVTDDVRPTFKGTLAEGSYEAGMQINIYDGATLLGSTVVDGDGKWSFEPAADLEPGEHSFQFSAVDAAGNESARSDPWNFVLALHVPDAPVIESVRDDFGSVTGELQNGGVTNDTSLIVKGTAEAGCLVILYANGVEVGSATADANGDWTITTSDLGLVGGDGLKELLAKAQGDAGQISLPSEPLEVILDTLAPVKPGIVVATDDVGVVTGPVANGGVTNDNQPTLSGTGVAGDRVTLYDNGGEIGSVVVDGQGKWTFTPAQPLADGPHSITATHTDPAGNTSVASDALQIAIWSVPPTVTIEHALDQVGPIQGEIANHGATDDNRPVLKGTATPGALVFIKEGAVTFGSVMTDAQGKWSFQLPLAQSEGEHTYTARVESATGEFAQATFTLEIDTLAPERPSIHAVRDDEGAIQGNLVSGQTTDDRTPIVEGRDAEPNGLVKVYDKGVLVGSVQADGNGHWSLELPDLADGGHLLTATVTDAVGRESQPSLPFGFVIDSVPTSLVIDQMELLDDFGPVHKAIANGEKTDDATPLLRGHVEGANAAYVEVYDHGTLIGTAQVDGNGNWEFQSAALDTGEHSFSARPVDSIGRFGEMTAAIAFEVVGDDTPPLPAPAITEVFDDHGSVTGQLSNGDATDDTSLTVKGTAEAGRIVVLYVNGEVAASTLADAEGKWEVELPLANDGEKLITARVQDDAGRHGEPSQPVTLVLDTTAPEQPGIVAADDDIGAVTGPIGQGGVTDDDQPTLSGQVEPGERVTILDNGEVIGNVVADGQGNWAFTPAPLDEGEHSISVIVTDAVGNASEPSEPLEFIVNAQPAMVTIDHALDKVGPVQGEVPDHGATDDKRPTLVGTANPNATVTIKEGLFTYGTVVADGDGNWKFQLPLGQIDGTHVYSAEVTTPAGGSASAQFTLDIDSVAPDRPAIDAVIDNVGDVQGNLAQNALTDDTQPTLEGTGDEGDLIRVYDNGNLLGSVEVDGDGKWSFTPDQPLADGVHLFTVRAEDRAGNLSKPSSGFTINIDGTPPGDIVDLDLVDDVGAKTGTIDIGSLTDDSSPLFSGRVDGGDAVSVRIYDGDTLLGSATVDASGYWSFQSPELSPGAHAFKAQAVDKAGNLGGMSDAWTFELVDGDIPVEVPVIVQVLDDQGSITGELQDGDVTDDTSLTVKGTATAGNLVLLHVNGELVASVLADDQGNWQVELPLSGDGEKSITVQAQDAAGRPSELGDPMLVVLDTTAPEVTVLELSDDVGTVLGAIAQGGLTDDTRPTLKGEASGAERVNIFDGNTLLGSAEVQADGSWSFTPDADLAEGGHSFSVVAVDAAGNESDPSDGWNFTVDLSFDGIVTDLALWDSAGPVNGDVPNGGKTDDTTPTLYGKVDSAGATTVNVYGYNAHLGHEVLLGSATVNQQTLEWAFTPGLPMVSGEHSFRAAAVDAAGNVGPLSETWSFTISLPKSDAPAIINIYDDLGESQGYLEKEDLTDDTTLTVRGSCAPGAVVTLYANGVAVGSQITNEDGYWTITTSDLGLVADGDGLVSLVASAPGKPDTGEWLVYLDTDVIGAGLLDTPAPFDLGLHADVVDEPAFQPVAASEAFVPPSLAQVLGTAPAVHGEPVELAPLVEPALQPLPVEAVAFDAAFAKPDLLALQQQQLLV